MFALDVGWIFDFFYICLVQLVEFLSFVVVGGSCARLVPAQTLSVSTIRRFGFEANKENRVISGRSFGEKRKKNCDNS